MEHHIPDATVDYFEWNDRLARHFFCEARAYRQVRLAVDSELLEALGGSSKELASAALAAAEEHDCETVEDLGLVLLRQWRTAVKALPSLALEDVPPFIAVLSILVLAVNHGGDQFTPHQYYDRLHDLLGSPPVRIDEIRRSLAMWRELAEWSTNLRGGRIGYFDVGILGQHRFVGVPRRQILIAPREREPLFRAMLAAGITPYCDASDARIVSVLRNADGILTRTRNLAHSWPNNEIAHELVEEVRSQLSSAGEAALRIGQSAGAFSIPLRLALQAERDQVVGGIFEAEIALEDDQDEQPLIPRIPQGSESIGLPQELWLSSGRSNTRPIVVDSTNDPTWVSAELWFTDIRIDLVGRDGALVRRKQRDIVFKASDAIDTLEEIDPADLRPGDSYLMARRCTDRDVASPSFASAFLDNWRTFAFAPSIAFRPFVAAAAASSPRPHPRIWLSGGVRTETSKNSYLPFALPEIHIDSISIDDSVSLLLYQYDGHGTQISQPLLLAIETAESRPLLGLNADRAFTARHTANMPALSADCAVCRIKLRSDHKEVAEGVLFIDEEVDLSKLPDVTPTNGLGLPIESADLGSIKLGDDAANYAADEMPPVAMHPIQRRYSVESDAPAQTLMHLLRSRGRISWRQAKAWIPSCIPHASSRAFESRYLIYELLALHALGIVEIECGRDGSVASIACLPPSITILPRLANLGIDLQRGRRLTAHEAVATGCWVPGELARLRTESSKARIELLECSHLPETSLVPDRRSLLVEGDYATSRLERLCIAVGVACHASESLAVQVARMLSPIGSLECGVNWTPGMPAPSLLKRYFDPRRIGTTREPEGPDDRFQVWECRHRDRNVWTNFLVDRELNRHLLVADRQIARWFVRRRYVPDSPIPITHDTAFVPAELRLPRILERTLCMSTGFAPRMQRYLRGDSPFENPAVSEHFSIPGPPERPVPWLSFRDSCSGNFVCYPEACGSTVWNRTKTLPLLEVTGEVVNGLRLGRR